MSDYGKCNACGGPLRWHDWFIRSPQCSRCLNEVTRCPRWGA